eukprot:Opistho-2@35584
MGHRLVHRVCETLDEFCVRHERAVNKKKVLRICWIGLVKEALVQLVDCSRSHNKPGRLLALCDAVFEDEHHVTVLRQPHRILFHRLENPIVVVLVQLEKLAVGFVGDDGRRARCVVHERPVAKALTLREHKLLRRAHHDLNRSLENHIPAGALVALEEDSCLVLFDLFKHEGIAQLLDGRCRKAFECRKSPHNLHNDRHFLGRALCWRLLEGVPDKAANVIDTFRPLHRVLIHCGRRRRQNRPLTPFELDHKRKLCRNGSDGAPFRCTGTQVVLTKRVAGDECGDRISFHCKRDLTVHNDKPVGRRSRIPLRVNLLAGLSNAVTKSPRNRPQLLCRKLSEKRVTMDDLEDDGCIIDSSEL